MGGFCDSSQASAEAAIWKHNNDGSAQPKGNTMAKQSFPGIPSSGGGILPKLISVLVLIGCLSFVVQQPVAAAQLVTSAVSGAGEVVAALAMFFGQVG